MAADSPVVALNLENGDPDPVRIFRIMRFAFGEHDDFREIVDHVLLGERVESPDGQSRTSMK
jgi:hypothetical protein